jgi:hypothetical protein
VASKDIRDLRWTLEFVVDAVGKTGEEVIVVGRDGQTELAAIICIADYRQLHARNHRPGDRGRRLSPLWGLPPTALRRRWGLQPWSRCHRHRRR